MACNLHRVHTLILFLFTDIYIYIYIYIYIEGEERERRATEGVRFLRHRRSQTEDRQLQDRTARSVPRTWKTSESGKVEKAHPSGRRHH